MHMDNPEIYELSKDQLYEAANAYDAWRKSRERLKNEPAHHDAGVFQAKAWGFAAQLLIHVRLATDLEQVPDEIFRILVSSEEERIQIKEDAEKFMKIIKNTEVTF